MVDRSSRVLVYGALVGLAAAAIASGEITVALLLAALKALLVGLEYMELRHAHRVHAVAFVVWVIGVTAALAIAL